MKVDHPRPYWHVDAKWITGLILFFTLTVTLLVASAWIITDRSNAIPVTTNLISTYFSHGSGDGNSTIAEIKAKLDKSHEDTFYPFEGLKIGVSRADLDSLTLEQIRYKIFSQLVEPLYDKGTAGFAASLTDDPSLQQQFANDATLLSFATAEMHQRILLVLLAIGLLDLLLLVGLVYFSYGAGKLVSPAVVLLLVSLPGLAVTTIGKLMVINHNAINISDFSVSPDLLNGVITPLWLSYLGACGASILLLIAAVTRKVFLKSK